MSLISTMITTYKSNNLSEKEIKKLQDKKLKKLVNYAKNNSNYFKKIYKDISDSFQLEDLPVTNKIELMNNFNDWLTDNNVNLNKIEEFTNNKENIGHMINNKYLVFKTSGSTGNPLTVLYDKKTIDVQSSIAALRTFARKEDLKSFIKNGKTTAGIFASDGFYLACGMSKYLQLKMPKKKNKITIDVNEKEEKIIEELNKFNPSMLSGYPSNLALLSNYKELNIKPQIVITGGELLTDEIREKLKDKFNCYVQTHYSCTEAGEIACECSEKHLHINEDWIIVEPVDKNNNPVDFGVLSDKVLITNLSNYIQPIIRYELTDRIILHKEKCNCGKDSNWLEIEGRTDDTLEFENNTLISPMSFYKILTNIKEITRFQLIQKSHQKLELRLDSLKKDIALKQAKKELQEFLSSKNINNVEIFLSEESPSVNKLSGKYNHIYKEFK